MAMHLMSGQAERRFFSFTRYGIICFCLEAATDLP